MDMDSVISFFAAMIRTATPLALATLACTISERAGVINIGIEGVMIASAFSAAVGAYYSGSPWVGLASGVLAGVLLSALIALLSIYCGGDQVVIGIGLNLLGPGLSYLIMYKIWGSRGTSPWLPGFAAVDIPVVKDIPVLGGILSGHNPCIYLCLVMVVIMHYIIYHTKYGLRVRAAGENPSVLQTAGVNVYRLRTSAVLWGGAMVGLSGVSLSLGQLNVFTNGMSADRGFLAYAANRFGQWTPVGSYLTCLLFGSMEALRMRMQDFNFPPQLLKMLPYVVTLFALMLTGRRLRTPAADGVPFNHPITIPQAAERKNTKISKLKSADKETDDETL